MREIPNSILFYTHCYCGLTGKCPGCHLAVPESIADAGQHYAPNGSNMPQSSAWSFPAELLFIPFTQEVVQGVLK